MTKNWIDYHCHLLPAIDDGSSDLDESLEMARILSRFGFSTVHCTPHFITGYYENEPQRVTRLTQTLQRLLQEAGIELKLVPGGEYYSDEFLPEMLPQALTAGASRFVLVEVPFRAGPDILRPTLDTFAAHGLTPLLAHPERCRAFDPVVREHGLRGALSLVLGKPEVTDLEGSEVAALQKEGCRFQGNLGSFAGLYGIEIRQRALLFLKHGVYSCLGSDSHRIEDLEKNLLAGYEAIVSAVGEKAADALLAENCNKWNSTAP